MVAISATNRGTRSAYMAAAIEANLVQTSALLGSLPGTEMHDEDPDLRFYVTAGVPFPLFNHIYLTRLPPENIDARIEEVRRLYAEHRLPFFWSTGPFTSPPGLGTRLESRGLRCVQQLPGMAADLRALDEDAPSLAGLTVERVRDAEVAREYVEVMRAGFGMPEFTAEPLFGILSALGFAEEAPFGHYVGRLDGEVLATASLSLAAGVAGIFNVATLPAARRRGLGTALTLAALRDARGRGYRIAILQSSDVALGIYRRLGFEQYSTYSVYLGSGPDPSPPPVPTP